MTYQAFPNIEVFNVKDEGCIREFDIMVSGDKYITQDDIYFNKDKSVHLKKIDIEDCTFSGCVTDTKFPCSELSCTLTYYNIDIDDYASGHFYMPGTREYQMYNKGIYAPSRFAFIEY